VTDERKWAERKVGFAKLWARAKQVLTTDPTGSDEDDHVVDEEAARVLAAQAGRLKGGLAKVAQLAAYDPGASLGRGRGASQQARAVLGGLWDHAPAMSAGAIAGVIEDDLGKAPQALFAHWDPAPLAAASIGQVHAARLADGTEVIVKVQYPGVADKLRADLDDDDFVRKLAGAEIGRTLEADALHTLGEAVRGELDYRAEAAAQMKFAAAWDGDKSLRVPKVITELSSARVLTMTRAKGKPLVECAASGTPDVRAQAALAIYKYAWGSPLAHGLLNADPNPGNYFVEVEADGHVLVHCLDFGCALGSAPPHRLARDARPSRVGSRARAAADNAQQLPLGRCVRDDVRRDNRARARLGRPAPACALDAALAPTPRCRRRDRHARCEGAVPPHAV
jgi:predicted unusual protein kinase regulating ubiquinone biosynthesis (AarF/ABC1/UbiB family)